jgi:hypothetical protein
MVLHAHHRKQGWGPDHFAFRVACKSVQAPPCIALKGFQQPGDAVLVAPKEGCGIYFCGPAPCTNIACCVEHMQALVIYSRMPNHPIVQTSRARKLGLLDTGHKADQQQVCARPPVQQCRMQHIAWQGTLDNGTKSRSELAHNVHHKNTMCHAVCFL